MLEKEARWLGSKLKEIAPDDLYPMCNVGSSTEQFRTVDQPYIDRYLFAPARALNQTVIHTDAKAAPGVDVVGDLTQPDFLSKLSGYRFRSAMCTNLLEHVTDRPAVCSTLTSLVVPGGWLFVTVPYRYPYHEDPIDTLFRPTVEQLARCFPGAEVHAGAIIKGGTYCDFRGIRRTRLLRQMVRAALPIRPRHGWPVPKGMLPYVFREYRVTCLVLRTRADGAGATSSEASPSGDG